MKIKILDCDSSHKISDAKIVINNGQQKIKWSYMNADGFFIIAYPCFVENFNEIEYLTDILEQKQSEKAIKERINDILFISLTKANFSINGIELGNVKEFKFPMNVSVIPFENKNNEIIVFHQKDGENTSIMQYVIKYSQKFAAGFLSIWKSKEIIKISSFEWKIDGLLYYTVSGNKIKYPINKNMLDREFEIEVPRDGLIDLKIAEDYKNYYRCSKG